MSEPEYIYYVYGHVDPRTEETIYVGHGCRGRAWIHGSKRTVLRSQDHLDHLESMTQDGFVATDWVVIYNQGLDKTSAAKVERDLIKELRPKYNNQVGGYNLLMTKTLQNTCKELKSKGMSYEKIADELKISAMTARRAVLDLYEVELED